MAFRTCISTTVILLLLSCTAISVPVNADSTTLAAPSSVTLATRNPPTETLAPPQSVTAKRYSDTAAEVFWARPATFGLRYEISRDGTLLDTISGTSYYDSSLTATSSPTYDIIAIDRQGRRSSPSSVTVPLHVAPTPDPTLAAPAGLTAQRYSGTAAEIFWTRPDTFGLSYEISRDGTLSGTTTGVSFYDDTLTPGVPASYSVTAINRQGQRSSASVITVPASNAPDPEPVDSLINADSYEQILQELITLINAVPMEELLGTQPATTDAGITFVSVSSEPQEDEVYGLGFVYDYSCDAGGTLQQFVAPEQGNFRDTFDDCSLEAGIFNGGLRNFSSRGGSTGVVAEEFTLDSTDQMRLLTGTRSTSVFRGVPGLIRNWQSTRFEAQSDDNTLVLNSYSMDATSVYNPETSTNDSDLLVSFDVTAPWTQEQNIQVDATLEASLEPDTAFTWQTGQVVATADDGSQLTLTPADVTQRTFNVALTGNDSLITRQWSEGFEIHCSFANIETCGSF